MYEDALLDLKMAGVLWELAETPIKQEVKKSPIQQNLLNTPNQSEQKIIPAIAPITLDTVKAMVNRPSDINSLVRMIGEFNHPLRSGVTNVVLPNIATNPNGLLIITDIPSGDDDLSGKILSGVAGEMIDKMLNAIEMSRESVSIAPLIFWRTPGGRQPTKEELELSHPFVEKIIEMLSPKIILTLGSVAAQEIGLINLVSGHGNIIENDKGYKVIPIYHPNYLILKPSAKKDVWNVLQNVQNLLKN